MAGPGLTDVKCCSLQAQPPHSITRKPSNQSSSVTPPPSTPAIPSPSLQETKVRARAMFCPLTGKGQGNPVPMCYRTLQIGTGMW